MTCHEKILLHPSQLDLYDSTWWNLPMFDFLVSREFYMHNNTNGPFLSPKLVSLYFNKMHTPIYRSVNTFTWLSVIERLHVEDSCTWLWDDFTNYIFHYRSYLYVTPKRVNHLVCKLRTRRWGRGELNS